MMVDAKNFIWYERHRPRSLDGMVLPDVYRKAFSEYISQGDLPHLLLYGPNGSGKTTIAFILFESIPSVRLVLNASSEDRGIATVKGKVKQFAGSAAPGGKLKIVFLDEADKLTPDAQDALRNTMETFSQSCRFILTGNYIDKITPALKSRCMMFEFTAFAKDNVYKSMEAVLQVEGIKFHQEDVRRIVDRFYPDIRSIMNVTQAGSVGGTLNPDVSMGMLVNGVEVLDNIFSGNLGKIRNKTLGITDFLWLYKFLYNDLLDAKDVSDEEKKAVVGILSDYLYRDAMVVSREINFVACCVELMGALGCRTISFQS